MATTRITYMGTHYISVARAAHAYAYAALPDASVVAASEIAHVAAMELEAHWYHEAVASEGRLDLPVEDGESVDEGYWRDACVDALETRIQEHRAAEVA